MQDSLKNIPISGENCPIRKTLSLLWWKRTLLIIFQINDRVIRFGELKRSIPGISEKMLIQELHSLAQYDLVSRKSYSEVPPKVEYTLTEIGKKSLPIIDALLLFWLENLDNLWGKI